jgi:hypothetical protein
MKKDMILKIKIDEKGLKQIKNRMGVKMMGGGPDCLSVPEVLWLYLIQGEKFKSGEVMDLTEKGGKLQKVLDSHS